MRVFKKPLVALFVVVLSGCGAVGVKDNLVVLDEDFFHTTEKVGSAGFISTKEQDYPALIAAYGQINGEVPQGFSLAPRANIIPEFMLNEPLVKKIVNSSYSSLIEGSESSIDITNGDIESFVAMSAKNYGAEKGLGKSSDSAIHKIIKKYLITYYSDAKNGFIDREGTVYKRPEIKTSIGNDIITAVALITLEGVFDGILNVPVYIDDAGLYQTAKGLEPTVHKLNFASPEKIVLKGKDGITKFELKAIRYLSGLASDQSKALSGLVVRAFGDLEIGFVIGGHFSFGDNDTLAKLLDTVFEVSSKRIVEAGAYKGFSKLTHGSNGFTTSESMNTGATELLETIENMN